MILSQSFIVFMLTPQKMSWQIANSVLNKGKSVKPPLFNGSEVLFSASGKAKLFAKNTSNNPNLDGLGIYLFTCSPF